MKHTVHPFDCSFHYINLIFFPFAKEGNIVKNEVLLHIYRCSCIFNNSGESSSLAGLLAPQLINKIFPNSKIGPFDASTGSNPGSDRSYHIDQFNKYSLHRRLLY